MNTQNYAFASGFARHVCIAGAAVLSLAFAPAGSLRAQGAPAACQVNGVPITLAAAPNEYVWVVLANFDHAPSTTSTTACLAERTGGGAMNYTVLNCPLLNNTAGAQLGGGSAAFDGNVYASCAVNVVTVTKGPPFTFGTRASFPAAGVINTIVSSPDFSFAIQRNAGCQLAMSSTYDSFAMAHTSPAVACGGTHSTQSRIIKSPARVGQHRLNGSTFGQTALPPGDVISVPASFVLQLSAPGSIFTADHIWVDPKGGSCCSGG
jgi:hypothetical protein